MACDFERTRITLFKMYLFLVSKVRYRVTNRLILFDVRSKFDFRFIDIFCKIKFVKSILINLILSDL